MQRLNRFLATAVLFVAAALVATPAPAQNLATPEAQTVRLMLGTLDGFVRDEQGGPLAGAMVAVLGQMQAVTVTDARGRFAFDALPIGEYVVQARLSGFAASRREMVRVAPSTVATRDLELRRLDAAVATTGTATPVAARPILAAGFGLPTVSPADQPEDAKVVDAEDHSHTATAWRLRHIRRSILKDGGSIVTLVERDEQIDSGSFFGRAFDSAAGLATLFADLPFSGEVNLLTTGAFAPGHLFSRDILPRGVAYLVIGAPTPAGDWSIRAAMSQGDLSSWILAGAFTATQPATHAYSFGLSYSTQEYLGGNPAALAAVTDGGRNVGELYAFDRWTVLPGVAIDYGTRYAWYDYLADGGLLSPRLGFSIDATKNTRVTATAAQRMVAPGAEEFLASQTPGPWLPPERTFAPLVAPAQGGAFRAERARTLSVGLEHQFDDAYVVGVRRFYQDVNDQLVTLFGLAPVGGPPSVGHYYVASAGAFDADGWGLRLSSRTGKRLRGSVDYSLTRARWVGRSETARIAFFAPSMIRPVREDLHDITTSLETDIPETDTRVFVLYRLNSGYTLSNPELTQPGFDGRFEVQVNQALPFGPGGTRWEILVGVRNLFRDATDPASIYDELLVMRPPKRVVGGVLVRF